MKVHEEFTGTINVDGVEYSYEGSHRDWNVCPGYTPPEGTVWEIYVENLPESFAQRHVMGFAGSKEEALRRLGNMIRRIRDYK